MIFHVLTRLFFVFFIVLFTNQVKANDSTIRVKIHFIYGSKPKREFKEEEKWFGGIHGGHVGIEVDSNKVFDFIRSGKTHVFSKKKELHGNFVYRSLESFYARYKASGDSLESAIVTIQLSKNQKLQLDSLIQVYTANSPYDYAFFGMRCGAAAYDVLSQLHIFPEYRKPKIIRKIFFPRKLRKRAFKLAKRNNWEIKKIQGTRKRKWENDN